jgi:uncharacterized protein
MSLVPETAESWANELLPLFPLQTVLFPGSVLGLKVFEARYVDLMSQCLREGKPFGVICLKKGQEVATARPAKAGGSSSSDSSSGGGEFSGASAARGVARESIEMEDVGVLAHIEELDAEQAGILRLRCLGGARFRRSGPLSQRRNGLWTTAATTLPSDPLRTPGPAMQHTVDALAEAITKLQELDRLPFAPPFLLEDAGWVANRWSELLPVPLPAKQKLMEMQDPMIRLSIVDGFLRDKKVVLGP